MEWTQVGYFEVVCFVHTYVCGVMYVTELVYRPQALGLRYTELLPTGSRFQPRGG